MAQPDGIRTSPSFLSIKTSPVLIYCILQNESFASATFTLI